MTSEEPLGNYLTYYFMHISAAYLCFIGKNALYFLIGWNNWTCHFFEYAITFLFLFVFGKLSIYQWQHVDWMDVALPALSQLCVTVLTCVIHDGSRDGSLYFLRTADMLVVGLIFYLCRRRGHCNLPITNRRILIILVIALCSCLGWIDREMIEVQNGYLSALALPFYAVAKAVHYILFIETANRLQSNIQSVIYRFSQLTSLLLLLPAIPNLLTVVDTPTYINEWELFDHLMVAMALAYMAALIYSKYRLMAAVSAETYCYLWLLKYALAMLLVWESHLYYTTYSVTGYARFFALVGCLFYLVQRNMRGDICVERPSEALL